LRAHSSVNTAPIHDFVEAPKPQRSGRLFRPFRIDATLVCVEKIHMCGKIRNLGTRCTVRPFPPSDFKLRRIRDARNLRLGILTKMHPQSFDF
jgi:hypothetical protein